MAERFKNLEKALCSELEKLDKKLTTGDEMTEQDLERADKLYHALKSAETYHAMKDAGEDESEDGEYSEAGRSYRRGGRSYRGGESYARYRSPRTGRFVSRDMGYDGGYSGYSGYYPMEYGPWDGR